MSVKSNTGPVLVLAKYYTKTETSNIEEIEENWKNGFRSLYGHAGNFLTTGKYQRAPVAVEPDFTSVTEGSYAYKALEKSGLESISEQVKENRKLELERPKMAATIISNMSAECLAHCAQAAEWKDLVEAGNDPLAIWKSMCTSLRTRSAKDVIRAKKAAVLAYVHHRQKDGQSAQEIWVS
jgi:hypothetical protein